ncbi:MAG: ABC transporter permease [Phycisphaerales bacterium]|nr:MAG: ABC transporter permease [Phycisphaerales bacterium]
MQKILKVAQREYVETVKTKTFIFMILMLPVMIVAIVFFAGRLESKKGTSRQPIRIAVTDLSGLLADQIKDAFDEHNSSNPKRSVELQETQSSEEQGKDKLRRGELDAFAVLNEDILEETGTIRLYTHEETRPAVVEALWTVESPLRTAVFSERLNLSPEKLNKLRKVQIERMEIGSAGGRERAQSEADRVVRMLTPFFFMYLLFIGILTMGQQMLSSIIEEKNSRVIEVLLSAVSPFELMAGKILGLVSVGLTVVFLWGVSAIGVARWQGLSIDIGSAILTYFILYYVLAFFMFGAFMVGIGSICNTIKETQSLLKPVILVCIVPIIAWRNIITDPNGILARVLSFVPPTSPMVMILRLSSGTEIWIVEILLSIILLAASVLGGIWVAAKVFRTGILMYGKRPGLREVGRWLKQA